MRAKCVLCFLGFTMLGIPIVANEHISFDNAVVRRPLASQDFTAAYVDITNHSDSPVTIAGASASWIGGIEFHETVFADGRVRMNRVTRLVLEPHATFHLAPGDTHIMFFRLKLNGVSNPTITFVTTEGEDLRVPFEIKRIDALDHFTGH